MIWFACAVFFIFSCSSQKNCKINYQEYRLRLEKIEYRQSLESEQISKDQIEWLMKSYDDLQKIKEITNANDNDSR